MVAVVERKALKPCIGPALRLMKRCCCMRTFIYLSSIRQEPAVARFRACAFATIDGENFTTPSSDRLWQATPKGSGSRGREQRRHQVLPRSPQGLGRARHNQRRKRPRAGSPNSDSAPLKSNAIRRNAQARFSRRRLQHPLPVHEAQKFATKPS